MSDGSFHFDGFDDPGFTMVPDVYFDRLLSRLTGVECKVLDYIFRRTFGFKKTSDRISLSQMVSGIKKADGSTLDEGVGESRSGVVRALAGLETKGIIKKTKIKSERHGHETNVYTLVFRDPSAGGFGWFAGGPAPSRPVDLARPPANTQETVLQNTDQADIGKTEETDPAAALWSAALAQLRGQMTNGNYTTWFEGTTGVRLEGETLVVDALTPFRAEALGNRFMPLIRRELDRPVRFTGG